MKLVHHIRRASSVLLGTSSKAAEDRRAKHVFTAFAKKRHLVYFASIDIRENDSRVVRGVTLGLSTEDSHHVVGTHDGYDMSVLCRQGDPRNGYRWVVMEFDLHTAVHLPHMIIGKKSEAEPLFQSLLGSHRDLRPHEFAEPETHHRKFIKHFIAYTPPAHAPLVEHIISPELTNALVDHIHRIIIEVEDDCVYLCVDRPLLSVEYLDKMMHYGIQFAKHIDQKMGAD